jgi:hypothetical protein
MQILLFSFLIIRNNISLYPLRPNRPISLRISCSTVIPPWEFNASPDTREANPAAHISSFHQMGKDMA